MPQAYFDPRLTRRMQSVIPGANVLVSIDKYEVMQSGSTLTSPVDLTTMQVGVDSSAWKLIYEGGRAVYDVLTMTAEDAACLPLAVVNTGVTFFTLTIKVVDELDRRHPGLPIVSPTALFWRGHQESVHVVEIIGSLASLTGGIRDFLKIKNGRQKHAIPRRVQDLVRKRVWRSIRMRDFKYTKKAIKISWAATHDAIDLTSNVWDTMHARRTEQHDALQKSGHSALATTIVPASAKIPHQLEVASPVRHSNLEKVTGPSAIELNGLHDPCDIDRAVNQSSAEDHERPLYPDESIRAKDCLGQE